MAHPKRWFKKGIFIFILAILFNAFVWFGLKSSKIVVVKKTYADTLYIYDTTVTDSFYITKLHYLCLRRDGLMDQLKDVNLKIKRLESRRRHEKPKRGKD